MRVVMRIVTVSVLVLTLGLHWAFLQTIAWTGMIIAYANEVPFQEAVSKTFDGKHPCPLCKLIKKGRCEEQKQEQKQVKPGLKLEMGVLWQATEFCVPGGHEHIPPRDLFGHSHSASPPKPPPRRISDNLAFA